MEAIKIILYILFFAVQAVIAVYLLIPPFFTFMYFLRRIFRLKSKGEKQPFVTNKDHHFAIVVTAHEETAFIRPLVDSVQRQTYPNYHVYIVADACDISTLNFSDSRVTVLRPETPLNAKIKSIDYAINHFTGAHDALIILDADNLIHPDFLATMDMYFKKGYRAVQADFKAKNTDSPYARMDAMGDIFNFFVEREMRMEMNISAAIWGSGIAIDLGLYKEVVYRNFLGGFDKKLQAHLVQRLPLIAFAKQAILYDEKIANGSSLEKQRTRWINAQFKYFKTGFGIFWKGLLKGNLNQAYFAFITIRPPMFLIIGLALVFAGLNWLIDYRLSIAWAITLLLFVLSFITIIFIKDNNRKLIATLPLIPLFMMRQALALLKIGKANKSFLKTQHTKVIFIDQLLQEQKS